MEELLLDEDSNAEEDGDGDPDRKKKSNEELKKKITEHAAKCPTNIKDLNFSRWVQSALLQRLS